MKNEYQMFAFGIPVMIVPEEGEQIRKHRKRRINKKWLKKYGVYHTGIKKGMVLLFNDQYGNRRLIMTKETWLSVKAKF